MVVPISTASAEYAKEVKATLRKESFSVDVDLVDNKMEKKIREAQLEQYNYIVVRLTVSALLALAQGGRCLQAAAHVGGRNTARLQLLQIGLCCRNYQCILGSRNALRSPMQGSSDSANDA